MRERNALRRVVYNMTRADKQIEEMAELVARLNWQVDAVDSMKRIRHSIFGDRYDGIVGLCALESYAAFRHPNSFAMIAGYRVFADAIRQQLEEALRRKHDAGAVGADREDGRDG